ncbi:hydrogen peroxide-inducible genes activator [Salipiger bermudensis]|uniref:Transcriptional regulator, LysR family protein n=1 Tax=Salipiger bermudensis (strain DSM 26914 / JCM 13377 / KCTC 12554 / HTCC2601) TaxID=314265 RepID=Q0FLU8_SALBH|nr:hydrogen peroxide-inducible genes activator [Salipiger bermudensis]EAU45136.1 transcriptional regulator, LysR family protein [Salipiger bermudensis HTCC2601]
MINPQITLRQLRFLAALAETLNFSRAAELCHVTQPTLSAGLRELEERLGVQLAERNTRSVILTPLGAEIAGRARALLLAAGDIEALAAAQGRPDQGDLRLGAIPTIGPYLIPRALPALRGAFPELRLFLREELTEQLVEGLLSGRLDLILFAQPFDIAGIETMHLFDDGYHLATPPGLSGYGGGAVSGEALEGARLMLLERGHCLQRHALKAFPDYEIEQDESFSATSLSTLISMVSEGLGITLLPDLAILSGVLAGQEVGLSPLEGACPRRVMLGWRPGTPRAEVFARLGGILQRTRAVMQQDMA